MTRKSDMDELTLKTGAAVVAVQAMLDAMAANSTVDERPSAVPRTQFETAFLWAANAVHGEPLLVGRPGEHTSELQPLMRISSAVCSTNETTPRYANTDLQMTT